MRKQILIIAMLIAQQFIVHANVLTVSNHPDGGSQYSCLQDAYMDASIGDTILLDGTNIDYSLSGCSQPFKKRLTIIGVGYNSDTDLAKRSRISATNCWSEFGLYEEASGSQFYGIEFVNEVFMGETVSNLVFENCLFSNNVDWRNTQSTNILFKNCVFDWDNQFNLYFPSTQAVSVTIENCIFDGYVKGHDNALLDVTFNHCVFLMTSNYPLRGFNNSALVTNSIFMNTSQIADKGTVNSQFDHNIFRLASALPVGNKGASNYFSTDPLFVNVPNKEWNAASHDYNLRVTSVGKGMGKDGTDIGVHGGTAAFSESGEVLIVPIVRSLTIDNVMLAPGGTLSVQIKAGKPITD